MSSAARRKLRLHRRRKQVLYRLRHHVSPRILIPHRSSKPVTRAYRMAVAWRLGIDNSFVFNTRPWGLV